MLERLVGYEQSGHLPHMSGDACRHYQHYEHDFDLARSWGHNAHRFSIEWSRIEPVEGQWNSVNDSAWSAFINNLGYKAAEAGGRLVKVNPCGTNQACLCGAPESKTLSQR